MTRAADLAKLIAGGGTITVADNSTNITLKSTDDDANGGPVFDLTRDSASPADNDAMGSIRFRADDDGGNEQQFVDITAVATDVTNGNEDAKLTIRTIKAGTLTDTLVLESGNTTVSGNATVSGTLEKTVADTSTNGGIAVNNGSYDAVAIGTGGYSINGGTATDGGIRAYNNLLFGSGSSSTERMRIDSSGNVLIGFTSAASNNNTISALQIEGTSAETGSMSIFRNGANANGAPLFLGKSRGSSVGDNTVVQSGDELGKILFVAADGTDRVSLAGAISCAIDATPGANDTPGRLVFSTTADGSNNITERMRIHSSGNVSVGVTSITSGGFSANTRMVIQSAGSGGETLGIRTTQSSGTSLELVVFRDGDDTQIGTIVGNASANTTSYGTSSDYRLKENVVNVDKPIEKLKKLKPKTFNMISDPDNKLDGFLAHELGEVIPNAAHGVKDAVNEDGSIKPQQVDYGLITPLLTAALQEAVAKIETLEAKVATLESK